MTSSVVSPLSLTNSEAAAYSGSDLELKFMVSTEDSVLALFFSVEAGGLSRDAL